MQVYLTLYKDNSTRIELRGLSAWVSVDTLEYINFALVTAELLDSDGNQVLGETWPLTLSYEAGSDGNYSGTVSADLVVSNGDILDANIVAVNGADRGAWGIPVEVAIRNHRQCK